MSKVIVRPIIDSSTTTISPSNIAIGNNTWSTERQYTSDSGVSSASCQLFGTRTRFLLLILVLFCLSSIWSNILTFNFAVICMNSDKHASGVNKTSIIHSNLTTIIEQPTDDVIIMFTSNQKSVLTSMVAIATLLSTFPIVTLVTRFGMRIVFTGAGILSAVATCLIPMAIRSTDGFQWMIVLRALQGIAFAANFPIIGSFSSKWIYWKQNGLFVSALVAYVQLSPALTMPISGALCTSTWSWPSVYYCHAIVGTLLFVLFAIVYRNSPQKHPCVGELELSKIMRLKSTISKKEMRRIPYADICRTPSVWAIWIAAVGNFSCVNMMFLFSPIYLHQVLGFHVSSAGISAALPPLAQGIIKMLGGYTSDKFRCVGETNKLRLYNSVAFVGSACVLCLLAFMPTEWQFVCLMLLAGSTGILGFTTGGFYKNPTLISKHYSAFVTGNISIGNMLTMLVVPFVIAGLAPNNTADEWRFVFLVVAGTLVMTNLFYVIFASAEPAEWTKDNASRNNMSKSKVYAVDGQTVMSNAKQQENGI